MMKRGVWGNALCFRKTVWCVRGGRFVDLSYAIFVSFAEGFAPVGPRVLVFAILSAFCLIICSPFFPLHVGGEELKRVDLCWPER